MISFTAFSQTLKPRVLTIENDTNFCFTIPQSRSIAKYLVKGQYADTLERNYTNLMHLYDQKEANEDSLRAVFQGKIGKLDKYIVVQDEQIDLLGETIEDRDKRIKRGKWQKGTFGVIAAMLTGVLILK